MIDVKELRVGNLVRMAGANYPVCTIHSDNTLRLLSGSGSIGCFKTALVKPIPLTEERLIKFGFEISYDGDWIYYSKGAFIISGKNKNTLRLWYKDIMVSDVHTLQNLYFALEKQELTIK